MDKIKGFLKSWGPYLSVAALYVLILAPQVQAGPIADALNKLGNDARTAAKGLAGLGLLLIGGNVVARGQTGAHRAGWVAVGTGGLLAIQAVEDFLRRLFE